MKNTITLFLFVCLTVLSQANAQNDSPVPDAFVLNPNTSVLVDQPFVENSSCCQIDTDLSCCQSSTWTIDLENDTNTIENTEYSRFIVRVQWEATGADREFTFSEDAGITLRDPAFDDTVLLTPSEGGRFNNERLDIIFEGDFPVPYNPTNGSLQIDFFQYSEDTQALWKDVILELYKPTDCDRPTAINDVAITSSRYDFEWTPAVNNNANQYYWQITPFSLSPLDSDCLVDSGTTAPGETAASSNKLMPGIPYILKIQSICDNDSPSIFKDKIFKTIKDGTPPLNDDLANAIPIEGDCFYASSTRDATIDEEDTPFISSVDGPLSNAGITSNNVWYSYTGSGTPENIFLKLCKSETGDQFPSNLIPDANFKSDINVYSGSSGNLKLVEYSTNDNDCGNIQKELSFRSDGTTTYYISIDGFSSDFQSGYFRLDVSTEPLDDIIIPENDECSSATLITDGQILQANLKNATPSYSVDIDSPCEVIDDWVDVWYKIVLNETSNLTLELQESGNTVKSVFALYSSNQQGCAFWDTRIPISQAYVELPTGDIDEIFGALFCVDQPEKTFTYRCLNEGEYFIRVFTPKQNNGSIKNAGIRTTVDPTDSALANAGSLTADQSTVVLNNGTATIRATNTNTNVPIGNELVYLVTRPNTTTISSTTNNIIPSFAVTQSGTYTIHTLVYDPFTVDLLDIINNNLDVVLQRLSNGCPDFDFTGATIEVTDQTLSSDRVNDYSFSFQPNPVNTTLSLDAKQPINKVVLYTIQGQRIRSTSPNTMHSEIDMSGLANGLYFVEVAINNTIQTARIIKQ